MIITFHTPKGIVQIDSNTATDEQLASIPATREAVAEIVGGERDLASELDALKSEVEAVKLSIKAVAL